MNDSGNLNLLCHRCGCDLQPGEGNFYVVRIEALADPTPPRFDHNDLQGMTGWEIDAEINRLIDDMKELSERQMMDQVFRRLTLHLCRRCYEPWIENPTG
jgi:hypothetical protein